MHENEKLADAIVKQDVGRVKDLLEGNPPADPNFVYNGYSMITLGIYVNNNKICELLAKQGADLNEGGESSKTRPFTTAMSLKCFDIVDTLWKYRNKNHQKPLNFDAQDQDAEGWSPLHWAATTGNDELVRTLKQAGCTYSLTHEGVTAEDLALNKGYGGTAKLIRDLGFTLTPQQKILRRKCQLVKNTGHLLGLSQNVIVDKNHPDKPVTTEGNQSLPSVSLLQGVINRYIKNPNPFKPEKNLDTETTHHFEEIAKVIDNVKQYLKYDGSMTAEKLAEIYHKNHFVLIPATIAGHDFSFLLYKGYLVQLNRGVGSLFPGAGTVIYRIPKENQSKINADFIRSLRPQGLTADAATIRQKIGGVVDLMRPQVALPSKPQKHGTCSYVNLEEAIRAMLFLKKQEKLYQALPETEKKSKSDLDHSILHEASNYAQNAFKNFSNAARNFGIFDLVSGAKGEKPKKGEDLEGRLVVRGITSNFYLGLLEKYLVEHHGQEKATGLLRTAKIEKELERESYILENLPQLMRDRLIRRLNKQKIPNASGKGVDLLTPALLYQKESLVDMLFASGADDFVKTMSEKERITRGIDEIIAKKRQQFKRRTLVFSDLHGPKTLEEMERKTKHEPVFCPEEHEPFPTVDVTHRKNKTLGPDTRAQDPKKPRSDLS